MATRSKSRPSGQLKRLAQAGSAAVVCLVASSAAIAAPATKPAVVTVPAPATQAATQPADPLAPLPWHASLQAGIEEAQRTGQPILVEVGAAWCGWCRKLEQEIATPAVQQSLRKWTRVRLDVDKDAAAMRQLNVGPVPALRVLSPIGRTAASRDGYLPADQLIEWLQAQRQSAAPPTEQLGGEPTDAASAEALVKRIADEDPIVRETVVRWLSKHPSLAAPSVVESFRGGNLAVRLATMELLQAWKAPLGRIDPWEPDSLTEAALANLAEWAAETAKAGPATQPATQPALSPAAAAAADRDLAVLLSAETESEALAARERLARLGMPLLPKVYAALKTAGNDRDRQRLTSLRYRAVASDALVLGWSYGFDQLASPDPAVRHAAIEALATRVKADESPLLLELFSDPDPFVRERSLKLLQTIGGQQISQGLIRLLKDPEPNVRAAVLKELASAPIPGMDREIGEFIKTETDPDLIVHAARVLREAKTAAAAITLQELLAHESWRVRAEAAEALSKVAGQYSSGPLTPAQKADIYAAMIKLLEDPDEFVVSRAVLVLRDVNVPAAIEPLVAAAKKRPELAADVVRALTQLKGSGVAHLREFCGHPSASVRAAAIAGLCQASAGDCAAEMKAAVADAESSVRSAALAAALEHFKTLKPPDSFEPDRKIDLTKWLTDFRAGAGRPAWATELLPAIEKIATTAKDDKERFLAAVALAALARDEPALSVLQSAETEEQQKIAAAALAWLPWESRLALYRTLLTRFKLQDRGQLMNALVALPDRRAVAVIWEVVAAPDADFDLASYAVQSLKQAEFGDRYYAVTGSKPELSKALVESATPKALSGTEIERLVALSLLASLNQPEAARIAKEVYAQTGISAATKLDAFQILLASAPANEASTIAVAKLKEPGAGDWEMRKVAVKFLAGGTGRISQLRRTMYVSMSYTITSFNNDGSSSTPKPPPGLDLTMLRPMLSDTDGEAAASASYLAVLLGEKSAFDTLVAYWRQHQSDSGIQELVYKAAAATGDDALVPALEEVFTHLAKSSRWRASDMYRTIRDMKGPNVLKLRKRMRDELGAEVLR